MVVKKWKVLLYQFKLEEKKVKNKYQTIEVNSKFEEKRKFNHYRDEIHMSKPRVQYIQTIPMWAIAPK